MFVSLSSLAEDVVLCRALGALERPSFATIDSDEDVRGLLGQGWLQRSPDATAAEPLHALLVGGDGTATSGAIKDGSRPWVVIQPGRSRDPGASGLVLAGYQPVRFDGRRTWWVRADRVAELTDVLDHPAQPEEYVPAEIDQLRAEVVDWRSRALQGWQTHVDDQLAAGRAAGAEALALELSTIRSTLSWRVTAPLRVLRRRIPPR